MNLGKTIIRVTCVDQRLVISSGPVIASGGLNEDKVVFDFCPLWNDFVKTAIFYRDKGQVYHSVLVDNTCLIPWEVTASEGEMYFGVFGVKGDITRTSEILRYKVVAGAITEDTTPSDPTPDIYEQILEAFRQTPEKVEQAIKEVTRVADTLSDHVSNDTATEGQFGHVKLMILPFKQAGDGFQAPDGEIVTNEDLKGYAASAFAVCAFVEVFKSETEDIESQLQALSAEFTALRKLHNELKARVDALIDAEGVEF